MGGNNAARGLSSGDTIASTHRTLEPRRDRGGQGRHVVGVGSCSITTQPAGATSATDAGVRSVAANAKAITRLAARASR